VSFHPKNIYVLSKLELDGRQIDLPHLESIVVLNIPFWGGGVKPWEIFQNEKTPKQS